MLIFQNTILEYFFYSSKKDKIIMPQLDQVTYFSQFFWLVIFLFTYYIIVVKNFLPKYSRILKVRNKKIRTAQQPGDSWQKTLADIPQNHDLLVADSLQQSRTMITQSYRTTQKRIDTITNQIEQQVLQNANASYVNNIAEFSLGLNVISSDVQQVCSDFKTAAALQWYDFGVVSRATLKNIKK